MQGLISQEGAKVDGLKTLGGWGITSLALTPHAVFTSSKGGQDSSHPT